MTVFRANYKLTILACLVVACQCFIFQRSEGELGDLCGALLPDCAEGLECTSQGVHSVCLPRDCAEEAFVAEFVDKNNIDAYAAMIMEEAGITDVSGILNVTTLEKGGLSVINENGARNCLQSDARDKIVSAMLAHPIDLSTFNSRSMNCTAGTSASSRIGPSVAGVTGFGGLVIELEAGGSFYNSYYFAIGTNDTAGGLYTDICLGIGVAAGADIGGLIGIAFSGAHADLNGFSAMFDGDIAAAIGVGISGGLTIPGFVPQLEFTLTAGVAAGIGGSLCFTTELVGFR